MTNVGVSGVFNILATPFTSALDVDVKSIATLVESVLRTGVDGVTVLGVAGEAQGTGSPTARGPDAPGRGYASRGGGAAS
jgi:hypothetical protein